MSKFFKVLSMIVLNALGTKSIGNPNARMKNDVRSKRSSGKVNMRYMIKG